MQSQASELQELELRLQAAERKKKEVRDWQGGLRGSCLLTNHHSSTQLESKGLNA